MAPALAVDQVRDIVDAYTSALDCGEMDAWLGLFAADGYYAVVRYVEFIQDNNVLLIGEDMKRLRARIESGRERDRRRMVHMVSGIRVEAAPLQATASFAMWYDGIPGYAGHYRLQLAREGDGLRIRQCTVVLDNDVIHTPIYMPI
jgi:3-phenylpropionate/cinnamic acid dioxygenase small subunit